MPGQGPCTGHGEHIRVLKRGHTLIGWEGIEENNLEEHFDIGEQANDVIQQLRGQLVAEGTCFTESPGQLSRCPAKVPREPWSKE